jgi:NADPH-dependent 2,4-dienoyl-CoA reductase/sulfur reductase-like enzyme
MAANVRKALEEEGVTVLVNKGAEAILGDETVSGVKAGGEEFKADLVIISTGAVPNTDLARSIGLDLDEVTGGMKTNENMQTSIPSIYAAGDCVGTVNILTGKPMAMLLAGIATRQGRVAGINMTGGKESYPGALGSWVICAKSFQVGGTGLTMKAAVDEGFDAVTAKLSPYLRPHYISSTNISLKLVAERATGKLLGGQAIGRERVSESVNYMMLAITNGYTVGDLARIDWCYAPGATECLNPIGRVAEALSRKMRA